MRHRSMLLARLSLRRRPILYWLATAVLAAVTALVIGGLAARAERAAARYGDPRSVVVALTDIEVGEPVATGDVEVQTRPSALVPEGALSALPEGRVALVPIYTDEPVLVARLAPDGLTGVAALLPEGTRALAVPTGPGALRLTVGDTVDVLATSDPGLVEGAAGSSSETVATGALVVDVAEDTVTVAVAEPDAPAVATALTQGTVTLALSSA